MKDENSPFSEGKKNNNLAAKIPSQERNPANDPTSKKTHQLRTIGGTLFLTSLNNIGGIGAKKHLEEMVQGRQKNSTTTAVKV